HPVELYAALGFGAAAIGLAVWKAYRPPPLGVPAGVALAAAGFIRLATEPLRPALNGSPVVWYSIAVIAGVGVTVWRWLKARTDRSAALPDAAGETEPP
ncbi:MAG: hypothetical protein ACR2NL_12755, partial [Acidimicrobiia bacterium]